MFSAVRSQHSGVDICINNAGLARPDTLLSGSTSGWKEMFNVRPGGRVCGGGEAGHSSWEESRKIDLYGQEESRKIDIHLQPGGKQEDRHL